MNLRTYGLLALGALSYLAFPSSAEAQQTVSIRFLNRELRVSTDTAGRTSTQSGRTGETNRYECKNCRSGGYSAEFDRRYRDLKQAARNTKLPASVKITKPRSPRQR